jgi:hypothetical protein
LLKEQWDSHVARHLEKNARGRYDVGAAEVVFILAAARADKLKANPMFGAIGRAQTSDSDSVCSHCFTSVLKIGGEVRWPLLPLIF